MEFLCCASTAELDPIERAKQAKVKADAANNKRINLGKCINNFYFFWEKWFEKERGALPMH